MIYLLNYDEKLNKPFLCFSDDLSIFNLSLDELLKSDLYCRYRVSDDNIIIPCVRPEWINVHTLKEAENWSKSWKSMMMKRVLAGMSYDNLQMNIVDDTVGYCTKDVSAYSLYPLAYIIDIKNKVVREMCILNMCYDERCNQVEAYWLSLNGTRISIGHFDYLEDNKHKTTYGVSFRNGKWYLGEFGKSSICYIDVLDILKRIGD